MNNKTQMPSVPRQAANLAGEVARQGIRVLQRKRVKVTPDVAAKRWEMCEACDQLINVRDGDWRCKQCGCHMQIAVWWASKKCRLGKWPQ